MFSKPWAQLYQQFKKLPTLFSVPEIRQQRVFPYVSLPSRRDADVEGYRQYARDGRWGAVRTMRNVIMDATWAATTLALLAAWAYGAFTPFFHSTAMQFQFSHFSMTYDRRHTVYVEEGEEEEEEEMIWGPVLLVLRYGPEGLTQSSKRISSGASRSNGHRFFTLHISWGQSSSPAFK